MSQTATHDASPRRERRARQQGQLPRSSSFVASGALLVLGLAFVSLAPQLGRALLGLFVRALKLPAGGAAGLLLQTERELQAPLLIWGLLTIAAPIGLSLLHLGPVWLRGGDEARPLARPQHTERAWADRLRGMLALALTLGLVALWLARLLPPWLSAMAHEPAALAYYAQGLGPHLIWPFALLLAPLGIADLFYQRHRHRRSLRMTPREMREEAKASEGDPRSRRSIRSLAREQRWAQVEAELGRAALVILDPARAAVAIELEPGRAPRLLAAGRGARALRLDRAARRRGLARAIRPRLADRLSRLDEGSKLPEVHFRALVAALRGRP